jgi:hypothetical protein
MKRYMHPMQLLLREAERRNQTLPAVGGYSWFPLPVNASNDSSRWINPPCFRDGGAKATGLDGRWLTADTLFSIVWTFMTYVQCILQKSITFTERK